MSKYQIYVSSTYVKELKKLKKKKYPIHLITSCLNAIIENDVKKRHQIKDHPLSNNWKGFREFHPARIAKTSGKKYDQWIVIYSLLQNKFILTLAATGNHDVFDKNKPKLVLKTKHRLI